MSRISRAGLVAGPTALVLLLAAPGQAFAQCAAPDYRGGRALPSGACPTETAGVASAVVWIVVVLAALAWLALAKQRRRTTTEADLALVDAGFAAGPGQEGEESKAGSDGPSRTGQPRMPRS
ncbi:hypothetical protein ACFV10_20455 [Streptomyces cyaneofuscatus]|uniref:hypothetical protein n=1 Tax=Streptomyces cyaneofuscatus TaxID=66883 RepID=UPI0036B8AD0B